MCDFGARAVQTVPTRNFRQIVALTQKRRKPLFRSAKGHVETNVADTVWLSLWRLLLALDHAAMPARSFGQQPRTSRSGFGLAIRALSFFNTGWKATTFTRDCPQQILVLDITPLDTAWAHIQEHASPQPLNASNASWACATRGVDVRSGKSQCCTSECHFANVAEHAIRALKGEVRSVFAPQLTFSRPQPYVIASF